MLCHWTFRYGNHICCEHPPHGDSLEVLHDQRPERIRLNGIDCPEKGQAYGNNARHAASALTFGKEITLHTHGKDKYGRTIADVLLPDATNVNHALVKDGWCWWYRKYAPEDTVLEGLENEAREAKKCLWADPQPVPPWEWRKKYPKQWVNPPRKSCLPLAAATSLLA